MEIERHMMPVISIPSDILLWCEQNGISTDSQVFKDLINAFIKAKRDVQTESMTDSTN